MKRILLALAIVSCLMSMSRIGVMASGFNVQSIGNSTTNGSQISKWWYTGLKPTLKGQAVASSDVVVKVDETETTVKADANGEWIYIPSAELSAGDHQIVLKNNGSELKFTLTLGTDNVDWDTVSQGGGDQLPATGMPLPTIVMLVTAPIMLITARKFFVKA